MPNKYFRSVDGGYLNDASWSLSDGGPNDTVKPTATDNVFFTANSGNCTATGSGSTSLGINFTGYTRSITWTSTGISINDGNITMSPTMTIVPPSSSTVNLFSINGNCTITTNGLYLPAGIFINSTSTITLADLLRTARIELSSPSTWVGAFGFEAGLLDAQTTTAIHIFKATNTYKTDSIKANLPRGIDRGTIKSDTAGTKTKLYATGECNIGYVDFIDIDASLGRPLYSFDGVISNCTNVFRLEDYNIVYQTSTITMS